MIQIQRECLMKYYNTENAYMKSLLWSEGSKDFPLKDYFIELTVKEADLLGKKEGETIQFTQIFPESTDKHVVMLVTGDPGYGKTTFCNKIAYDWGTDTSGTDYLGHYDFTIVIILRELEKKSITDEILQRICENTDSSLKKTLREKGFNLLIILDGFDETDNKDSIIQFIKKDSVDISKLMTILVTCRPHAAENIRKYAHMRFVIRGFSQQQKERYIKLVINDDNGRRDELINLIKFSNFHSALAECPLMLHMLCCLPQTKYFHKIQTKTDLFIQIFRLVIKRYMRKMGEKHHLKKGKFFYGENLLVKLGEIHLDKRSKMSKIDKPISMYEIHKLLTLTDKQLKKKFPEEEDFQFILGLDIFAKYFEVNGISCFDFLHRSFFDFIIALCYYHSKHIPLDCAKDFIILTFLCGLCGDEEFSSNFIYAIRQNVYHPTCLLECVNEIKNITNKQLFCSNAKVYFDFTYLKMMTIILELPYFRLSQIYFHFPDAKHLYEKITKQLIDLQKIYKESDKLEIFLLLDKSIKFVNEGNSFKNEPCLEKICDIRQSVILIQKLINSFKWDKFKICFSGVFALRRINPILHYSMYNFFKDVENPTVIPKDLNLKLHKRSKSLVALLTKDEFIGEVKYLISNEQYLNLKDNIKLSSDDK
ncbi:uncharacterized protein LOC111631318 isoform X3 [Centruroides sculpturatus]|uniref:uncharacterized protein LOC111631318 isoform X3 n=1 Tax=Centruroides sculpturatus TaxID=218467 RepID=UPI000C6CEA83|nr:uncharacterized protein LOC111631318 isoform X3 [Centruroides sculpturatus]XP_023231326.1 uncharacterized protein LOC111631318 isoform X3 [Centruroides sculpturatus]